MTDEIYMQQALLLAQQAYDEDEVPVGAIVVGKGRIIAKAYNQTEKLNDVTAHAEILAITAAANNIGAKYLKGCTLYVTMEPCVMCAGALAWSQIDRVVFGAYDPKRGFQRVKEPLLHQSTEVIGGILEHKCSDIVKTFFQRKRN